MSKEYTQVQAYKQLLEVTENILGSLSTEPQIMKKYKILKQSIMSKIIRLPANQNQEKIVQKQYLLQLQNSLILSILRTSKSISDQFMRGVTIFEQQIQGEMNRQKYSKECQAIMKNINKQLYMIQKQVGSIALNNFQKVKSKSHLAISIKEQISALSYQVKQFEAKLQNMGLMIEVHCKMHEIILEASSRQTKRSEKENQYTERLNYMQDVVNNINDVKKFIDQYGLTRQKLEQYDRARKHLGKVLFDL